MKMRTKIILFFICLVSIPIMIIYAVASTIYINSTKNDMRTLYANNIKEVGKNAEGYFTDALDLTLYPLMERNLKTFLLSSDDLTAFQNANDILLSMPYGFSEGIRGIALKSINGAVLSTGTRIRISEQDISRAKSLNADPYWDFRTSNEPNGHIYLTRLLKNPSNISEHIGYIKMTINCGQIVNSIEKNSQNGSITYYIMDQQSHLVLSSGDTEGYQHIVDLLVYRDLEKQSASGETLIRDDYFISAYQMPRTSLIVFSITKPDTFAIVQDTLLSNLAVISVLVLIFSVLLAVAFSKIITRPLNELGQHMQSISQEDFTVRATVKHKDEIAVLSNHFNDMARRLEFVYKEVYMKELQLKQSQLNMLQTQVNPHFLYNTLDTIYWMSEMGDTRHVSKMVSNLSKLMRLTLSPSSEELIPLEQELEHLTCYIEIQKLRYGDNITFDLTCPEELKQTSVMKFLLQPLVENAVTHGLSSRVKGTVQIHISETEGAIVYEVANDGEPINVEEINQILQSRENTLRGFALRNIKERILLKYGDSSNLTFSFDGKLSVFKIIQPVESPSETERNQADDQDINCGR